MKTKKGFCVLCGAEFLQQGSRVFRCSNCKSLNSTKLGLIKRYCFVCGKVFVPAGRNANFCSDMCRKSSGGKARPETPYEERARIAKEAWEKEHMSYGQYVAKYGL